MAAKLDDPNFLMNNLPPPHLMHNHVHEEPNYSNLTGDRKMEISLNNKHNNMVEDFSTRGSYYKLDYNSEDIKL